MQSSDSSYAEITVSGNSAMCVEADSLEGCLCRRFAFCSLYIRVHLVIPIATAKRIGPSLTISVPSISSIQLRSLAA
jgi:hypothetical protein